MANKKEIKIMSKIVRLVYPIYKERKDDFENVALPLALKMIELENAKSEKKRVKIASEYAMLLIGGLLYQAEEILQLETAVPLEGFLSDRNIESFTEMIMLGLGDNNLSKTNVKLKKIYKKLKEYCNE
jgi:hypothetical protein